MNLNASNVTHLVVDMLYDFIDGSLACQNSIDAVSNTVKYINDNPYQRVLYICDNHPTNHCSFKENGGIWPVHCVQGTRGAEIHSKFFGELSLERIKPHNDNVFLKGRDPQLEQYSGFDSHNLRGEGILNYATKKVVISGIATEFCVKESCMELLKAGYDVYINRENLAYVNFEGHLKALKEMEMNGAMII